MTETSTMQKVVESYFKLWKSQDANGLSDIFLTDAKYIVQPFGVEEYTGIDDIKQYWKDKPVNNQISPKPKIISSAYENNLAFVEWETSFLKPSGGIRRVRGILVLEFIEDKIKELREHYNYIDEQ